MFCTRPTSSSTLVVLARTSVVLFGRRTLAFSEKITTFTNESAPLRELQKEQWGDR